MARKTTVNLDALIPRADILIATPTTGRGHIPISELNKEQLYYHLLRKPNFQRETDDWDVDNVVSLIRSFREGHLIPAVILWAAQGQTFVIDGAHRLSVFIGWVNDDYGDRSISEAYFKHNIPQRQRDIAKECRAKISAEGLAYSEMRGLATIHARTPDQARWSTNVVKPIETQWVEGNAEVAAQSFLDINQRAVEINPTERYMIEKRRSPAVIAARAIVNKTRGHAYWGGFLPEHVATIEAKAVAIHNAIFEPEDAAPQSDMELQPAGPAYTANGLRLALELVMLTNNVKDRDKPTPDVDGSLTAEHVSVAHGVIKYMAGNEPASFSLHPSVYFWGSTGNHRPALFLAMLSLMQDMIHEKELFVFTLHRARFEEFLVGKSGIGKELLSKYGGWGRSVTPIKKMLRGLLDGLIAGSTDTEIEEELMTALKTKTKADEDVTGLVSAWGQTRSALRIKASLEAAPRCTICKARMVPAYMSNDHIKRQAEGGPDHPSNAQLVHHFCNHGFKEHYTSKGQALPEIATPV